MLFVWIALYGVANLVPNLLQGGLWLWGISAAAFDCVFLVWIIRTGRRKAAGLVPVDPSAETVVKYLPVLAVFPLYNMICAWQLPRLNGGFWLHMFCVALTEEVVFRGFLLNRLRAPGTVRGILLTSLAFALLHGLNVADAGADLYLLLQILSSFAVSLCYCVVTLECGSIYPCIVAHFLTNITAAGSVEGFREMAGLLVCAAVSALWSLWRIRENRQNKRKNELCH